MDHNGVASSGTDEVLTLTYKWLNLKYSLRKVERNWEPKSKKILNDLYAQYKDIDNIELTDDEIKWINLNKSILRKYISKLEKKFNYISFLNRLHASNNSDKYDIGHMNTKKKNKWQSQQIKKKNIYKMYAPNIQRYKHSKKQIIFKTKIKPNLKKKQRYSVTKKNISYDNIYMYSRRNRHKNERYYCINNPSQIKCNFIFCHTLSYLLACKTDNFLNKQICINNGEFKGKLTCISQSGQYKLERVLHKNKLTKKYSYWFHLNRIDSVHVIDNNNNNNTQLEHNMTDITDIFMDIIKLKTIQYFMFICSYKLDENKTETPEQSPLKCLFLKNILNKDENILKLNYKNIQKCKFTKKMLHQFCSGAKNNRFDYFDDSVAKPLRFYIKKPQLSPAGLLSILWSYICLCKDYVKNISIEKQTKIVKDDYTSWDTIQVKKSAKYFTHDEYKLVNRIYKN